MAKTERLKAELTLDDSKFMANLRKAEGAASTFAGKLSGVALKASAAGFAALTAGATAAGVALIGAVKRATELGGAFSDLAARTAVPVAKLTVMSAAFKNAGLEGDELGKAINYLQKKLEEGSSAFGKLGLSVEELKKLSPDEQFMQVGKAIAGVSDSSRQAAISMELFGRTGAKLLTVFKDDKALEKAARVLGSMPEILQKNADLFDRFSDNVGNLSQKWDAFAVGVASRVVPALDALLERLMGIDTAATGQKVGDILVSEATGKPNATAMQMQIDIKRALQNAFGKDNAFGALLQDDIDQLTEKIAASTGTAMGSWHKLTASGGGMSPWNPDSPVGKDFGSWHKLAAGGGGGPSVIPTGNMGAWHQLTAGGDDPTTRSRWGDRARAFTGGGGAIGTERGAGTAWQALQSTSSAFSRLQAQRMGGTKVGSSDVSGSAMKAPIGLDSVFLSPSRSSGGVRKRGESKEDFRARMDAAKRGEKMQEAKDTSLEGLVQQIADSLEGR